MDIDSLCIYCVTDCLFQIASLKETVAAAGGKPPKPTTRKPSVSTAKQSTVSSPRTTRYIVIRLFCVYWSLEILGSLIEVF